MAYPHSCIVTMPGAGKVSQPHSYFAGLAKSSMVLPKRMPVVGDTTPEPKGVLICRSAMKHTRNTNRGGGVQGRIQRQNSLLAAPVADIMACTVPDPYSREEAQRYCTAWKPRGTPSLHTLGAATCRHASHPLPGNHSEAVRAGCAYDHAVWPQPCAAAMPDDDSTIYPSLAGHASLRGRHTHRCGKADCIAVCVHHTEVAGAMLLRGGNTLGVPPAGRSSKILCGKYRSARGPHT